MSAALPSLADWQDAFVAALFAPDTANAGLAALTRQPAFAVVRNTVMKGCIDALQANYPAVARLVGEEWLRAAAAEFARRHPPGDPVLLGYGAGFADFLAAFPPAADLPYLPAVARLDRFWTEAHVAADARPADPAVLVALPPAALGTYRLVPHPAARWAWCADAPAYTIWSRNRSDAAVDDDLMWQGEGALVTRPGRTVQWCQIDAAACAFLDACAAGGTLGAAAIDALTVDADCALTPLMARLLEAGALADPDPTAPPPENPR